MPAPEGSADPDGMHTASTATVGRRRKEETMNTKQRCDRTFTPARQEQGFTPESLEAFATYYDHTQSCEDCGSKPVGGWIDDSWQPGMYLCPKAERLRAISDRVSDHARTASSRRPIAGDKRPRQ